MAKTVEDLMQMLQRIESADAAQEAQRELIIELKTAIVDLVDLLEKQGPMTAKAVAEGLRSAQLGQINVQPAPVQVIDKTTTVAAPAASDKGKNIDFKFDHLGNITGAKLTPIL